MARARPSPSLALRRLSSLDRSWALSDASRARQASGFGVNGSVGRCHAFWMEFRKCMSEADTPRTCFPLREDYLECLHHRKEARRLAAPLSEHLLCSAAFERLER